VAEGDLPWVKPRAGKVRSHLLLSCLSAAKPRGPGAWVASEVLSVPDRADVPADKHHGEPPRLSASASPIPFESIRGIGSYTLKSTGLSRQLPSGGSCETRPRPWGLSARPGRPSPLPPRLWHGAGRRRNDSRRAPDASRLGASPAPRRWPARHCPGQARLPRVGAAGAGGLNWRESIRPRRRRPAGQ
jgi:hypothetical protein